MKRKKKNLFTKTAAAAAGTIALAYLFTKASCKAVKAAREHLEKESSPYRNDSDGFHYYSALLDGFQYLRIEGSERNQTIERLLYYELYDRESYDKLIEELKEANYEAQLKSIEDKKHTLRT